MSLEGPAGSSSPLTVVRGGNVEHGSYRQRDHGTGGKALKSSWVERDFGKRLEKWLTVDTDIDVPGTGQTRSADAFRSSSSVVPSNQPQSKESWIERILGRQ